jgi:hypothetical protein
MQLTGAPRRSSGRRRLALAGLIALGAAGAPHEPARAADPPTPTAPTGSSDRPTRGTPLKPQSDTTKIVGVEVAAYDDSDHVTVFTPSIHLGLETAGGLSVAASYLVDVVSAASVDVVSTASSRWQEIRHAGTLTGQYKPRDFGIEIGGAASSEPDYLAYGAYAKVIKDFDQKNWTVTLGYGMSRDVAGRCGVQGACTPFSVFSRDLQRGALNGGLAWAADPRTLAAVGVDFIFEYGDQSKPYRYIPMFAPDVAAQIPKGASIEVVNAARLPERPLEQLPLSRRRIAFMASYAHRFDGSTVRLEERVYNDSWGLVASSTDAKWIVDLGDRFDLWPHLRFHAQSEVSFWQRAYVSGPAPGWNLPEFRTGDRELGPLWTAEGGFGARWYVGPVVEPRMWALGLTGTGMYTAFLDDLYLLHRLAGLFTVTLEARW